MRLGSGVGRTLVRVSFVGECRRISGGFGTREAPSGDQLMCVSNRRIVRVVRSLKCSPLFSDGRGFCGVERRRIREFALKIRVVLRNKVISLI